MYNLKIISKLTLVIGVPLIALFIAGRVAPLASFSHNYFHSSTSINQVYQPPSTIGAPSSSLGSGTR